MPLTFGLQSGGNLIGEIATRFDTCKGQLPDEDYHRAVQRLTEALPQRDSLDEKGLQTALFNLRRKGFLHAGPNVTRSPCDKTAAAKERSLAPQHATPEPLLVQTSPAYPSPFGTAPQTNFQPDVADSESHLLRLVAVGGVLEHSDANKPGNNHGLQQLIRAASREISNSASPRSALLHSPGLTQPLALSFDGVLPAESLSWQDLPLDVWLKIISNLKPSSRSRARGSCTTLREATNLSTHAVDFGDLRSNFFYDTPCELHNRHLSEVGRVRCANLQEIPVHEVNTNMISTLELKSLVSTPSESCPTLPFPNLVCLKASRAPQGIDYGYLPTSLTSLTVGSLGPGGSCPCMASQYPALPPSSLAPSFSELSHLDVPLSFPMAADSLFALSALPALKSLGNQGRINVDDLEEWGSGLHDLAYLTGLTRLSFTTDFTYHLSQLSVLKHLQCVELFAKEGAKEADWEVLVTAIPGVTSLTLHNAPTPEAEVYVGPVLAASLPHLQSLVLTSTGTQFDFVVQLPAMGPMSGLTALTHLSLKQTTMQDPALRAWLLQLEHETAPPNLQELELEGRAGGYQLQAVSSCPHLRHLSLAFPEQSLEPAAAAAIQNLGQHQLSSLRLRTPFSPPDLLEQVLLGVPGLSSLDIAAPRLSRVPLEDLVRQIGLLANLESLTLVLPVTGHSSLTGTNSFSHLCRLTCLDTLQVRCYTLSEQVELQQKLGQLASHPSMRNLQVQLPKRTNSPEYCQPRLGLASVLNNVALRTGARVSMSCSK